MILKKYNKIITLLLPLTLLVAGLYFVPIKIFKNDFSKVPGDFGDARFNNYVLEHGHKYLIGDIDNYWDAPFMYPYTNVISFSDNLLGTMPIYSAFRVLGLDRETSFQFWLLTLFALNFICCYWVLMRWSNNTPLSVTGAYIYAFSIFILGHIYNVQVFPRFMVPLVFYWTWKYLSQKQIKYFLFTLFGLVYQFYSGIYLGFLLAYTLLFLIIAYLIIYRDKALFSQFTNIRKITYHLLIVVISVILITPLMLPYIEISHTQGFRHFEDALSSIPTLRSYFFTSKAPVLWSFLSEHGIPVLPEWWCHHLFMGALPWMGIIVIPIILLSKKINSEKKKFIAFLSIGLFLSFIFCLNINGFTLYRIIFKLPGFSSMRAINRVINTEVMYFILIFVFVFNELRKSGKIMKWIVMSFPLLIIVDNLINTQEVKRYDKQKSQQQIEAVKENIKNQYNNDYKAIAYMPKNGLNGQGIKIHLNVMLAAQELNIPCVNAYTGSYPSEYLGFSSRADDVTLDKWIKFNNIDKRLIQTINDFGKREINRKLIHLKATNDKYVCADKTLNNFVVANRDNAWLWETFTLIQFENNECAILAYDNHFLCAEIDKQNEITATRANVSTWETFTIIELGDNYVAFKAVNGKYLSLDEKSLQLFAIRDTIGRMEKFKLLMK